MRGPWLVSPALAEELGPDTLAQLDDIDPASALTCQVCGKVKPTGDLTPMALVAAQTPDGATVVGLAHRDCRDLVGDHWPPLLERLGDADGIDSMALLAIRVGTLPRAVLAYEPNQSGRALMPTGDGVDLYLSLHLELGFTLMSAPIADLTPPLARGWTLNTRGGTLTLEHSALGPAYTQELTEQSRDWLRIARGEGRCLVITGSGLNIDPNSPLPEDFTHARLRSLAVAAAVRVR